MEKLEKNLGIIGLLRCSVGSPRRGVAEVPKMATLTTRKRIISDEFSMWINKIVTKCFY